MYLCRMKESYLNTKNEYDKALHKLTAKRLHEKRNCLQQTEKVMQNEKSVEHDIEKFV